MHGVKHAFARDICWSDAGGGLTDVIQDNINGCTFFDFKQSFFFDSVKRAVVVIVNAI